MKLDTYLTENKLTEAAFGKKIGIHQSQVNRLRNDKSWPPKALIDSITAETGGAVTANDFQGISAETSPQNIPIA